MQSYILTTNRLRKREPLIALGRGGGGGALKFAGGGGGGGGGGGVLKFAVGGDRQTDRQGAAGF